ncbi:PAS domain S-box protein [Flavobacterium sp. 7A]|uniref:GAF domain-containing sensor histidine kinase n=1 Tax=Flavobacterium sp. 7A TaxID=2940571 RepID=UPI0022274FD0|nr:PAS domain S-box protein [Flavobacterium sp. 7A]MCW2120556.1 PAS domain S-box-containing protein [Flavobacterium sp. 7A]
MKQPTTPTNETERLKELESYKIIGELENSDYDFLTKMAAEICGTKISLISLITEDKQWFLSHHGIDSKETSKDISFCAHAINNPKELFMIENSNKDDRFFDNPLATGDSQVVFYAGVPLVTKKGFPLGTLCVINDKPHTLNENQINSLRLLSNQVMKLFELHRKTFTLKKQNSSLKKITELFKESQKINHVGTWELDLDTNKTTWTDEVYAIHEVPLDFHHNKTNALEFYHPEDQHIIIEALANTIETEEPYDVICRFITAKNTPKWVRASGKIWKEKNGKKKLIGIFQDITEQKTIEDKLRISEEAFRGNFEHGAIGMALLDENRGWLKVNKKLCDILGYSAEELMLLSLEQITHPDDSASDLYLLKELIQEKRDNYTLEKRYIHKDGRLIHAISAVSTVKNKDHKIQYFVAQIVDITIAKNFEIQLAKTISNSQAILDANTQVAIIGTDLDGKINLFNKGAEQMLGYTANEVIGKYEPKAFHKEEELKDFYSEKTNESDSTLDEKDPFSKKIKIDLHETNEWTYIKKDKTTLTVLLSVTSIIHEGNITGYLGVAADITETKNAARETAELLEIAQSQNDRLKNFAYIVSHNLRSHSGGISSLIELMESESPSFARTEIFEYLKKSSENLSETIKHLTEVVQINLSDKTKLKSIPLKLVIDNNINSLMLQAKNANITIINTIEENINVSAIPAYLDSIVMNFITNAIKYCSPERDSFLEIKSEKNKNYVILKFIDNGLGINLEKHGPKLFGMYKTFHNHSDSQGIGLFISKNQIEAMNGKIEVESETNVGTTFKIYFEYEED